MREGFVFSMKSEPVTLNSRSVRVVIGVGVVIPVWMFLLMGLNHRCNAGYEWFEHYSPLAIGILGALSIVFIRRLWLALFLAASIALAFSHFVIPPYLAWIHGPNRPNFPAAQGRELKDLRIIDEAITVPEPDPAPAQSPSKP